MRITITGTANGLGQALAQCLSAHDLVCLTRNQLNLNDIEAVTQYDLAATDMLINCAGTGVGGKQSFVDHPVQQITDILNTNLLAPVILSHKALAKNVNCKIVNITSTNNNRYHSGDLAYSLSKNSLATFGSMLRVEYPNCALLEVRLGLTKTNFNQARYRRDPERYQDIYQHPHLDVDSAAQSIVAVLFDQSVKMIELSP